MVCIQCYLPPILFMLYMKFIQPIIRPYIQPAISKVLTYLRGSRPVQAEAACPLRPSTSKNSRESEASGDSGGSSFLSKSK